MSNQNYILKIKNKVSEYLTILKGNARTSQTRETALQPIRDTRTTQKPIMDSFKCPYCFSSNYVKRGFRQKKYEKVQLYICLGCNKTFTANITRGKHYPLDIVLDAISLYNLGYSLEETCKIVNQKQTSNNITNHIISIQPSTLSNWLSETQELCRFSRMRSYAIKKYSPKDIVISATLAHQQLFRYHFHRAKCELIIEDDFKHRRFGPLQEFLEMVPVECPHQYFNTGLRASETPISFSKKQMIVRAKKNHANKLCQFALQSAKDRTARHEALQKFMLANDSVTVATEVPVYLTRDDLGHMRTQLGFEMYQKKTMEEYNLKQLPKLITGHIDILQIRNGQIHLLDYKPNAERQRPIEQLTLYAMALSRLTGLRMFEFKCAWFDEKDYFEFYPLHVLYKPKRHQRRKKITTDEGVYLINRMKEKVERIRPI